MDKLHLSDLMWIGAIVLAYWFLSSGAPAAILRQVRRWSATYRRYSLPVMPATPRRVMSRPASMRRPRRRSGPVSIPVSGMPYQGGGMVLDRTPLIAAAPDMDAPNASIRLRSLPEGDLLALLAVQRGADGKHRFSGNKIYALLGGDRNAVLDRIREIREGTPAQRPSYPKLADDKTRVLA